MLLLILCATSTFAATCGDWNTAGLPGLPDNLVYDNTQVDKVVEDNVRASLASNGGCCRAKTCADFQAAGGACAAGQYVDADIDVQATKCRTAAGNGKQCTAACCIATNCWQSFARTGQVCPAAQDLNVGNPAAGLSHPKEVQCPPAAGGNCAAAACCAAKPCCGGTAMPGAGGACTATKTSSQQAKTDMQNANGGGVRYVVAACSHTGGLGSNPDPEDHLTAREYNPDTGKFVFPTSHYKSADGKLKARWATSVSASIYGDSLDFLSIPAKVFILGAIFTLLMSLYRCTKRQPPQPSYELLEEA